jgi:hypothetical protein
MVGCLKFRERVMLQASLVFVYNIIYIVGVNSSAVAKERQLS